MDSMLQSVGVNADVLVNFKREKVFNVAIQFNYGRQTYMVTFAVVVD